MSDANSLSLFFDSWDYFRDAALAGTIAGAILGMLGVYIVLRRMVFLSAALAQASGLGVAYSFYVSVSFGAAASGLPHGEDPWWVSLIGTPYVGATLAALGATLLLSLEREQGGRRDSFLGLAYLLGAAGTLALGTRIVQEIQDIQTLLFGNAVVVLEEDLRTIAWGALGLAVLHVWLRRGFMQASFDAAGARVRGLPVRALNITLMLSLALAVSLTTRILGALPVFAFSILPAMAALRIAPNASLALLVAAGAGALAGFCGYVVAFLYQLPVGASQTLVAVALVVLVEGARLLVRGITWAYGRRASHRHNGVSHV